MLRGCVLCTVTLVNGHGYHHEGRLRGSVGAKSVLSASGDASAVGTGGEDAVLRCPGHTSMLSTSSPLLSFVDRSCSVGCRTGEGPATPAQRCCPGGCPAPGRHALWSLPRRPLIPLKLRPLSSLPSPQASQGLTRTGSRMTFAPSGEEDVRWSP